LTIKNYSLIFLITCFGLLSDQTDAIKPYTSQLYFSPLPYSINQCSDNYKNSIKNKTSCCQHISAHFDTTFA